MYTNTLTPISHGPPILADYPRYVEPLQADQRFLAPPVVNDPDGKLRVRAWRYWYNARGIVETENRLDGSATAILVVHPWGLDDGHGLKTPEPAGVAFFCTLEKNTVALGHVKDVMNPFLRRLRKQVALVGYSLPGVEDGIRKLMYASIDTSPEQLQPKEGERQLAALYAAHPFGGEPLATRLELDAKLPAKSYMEQTPSTDASDRYNGRGYWELPMPIISALQREPADRVFYDGEGYAKVRDYLRRRGIRHVLLAGYATDMCVISTTCGWQNLTRDFNVFMVGDVTLATFPASTTPRFATQVSLVNSSLHVLITQASWIHTE